MGTLLKSHAVRHSLTFRNLKKARSRQVALLGDKIPSEKWCWHISNQPAPKKKYTAQNER